jgi:hypothetical protein
MSIGTFINGACTQRAVYWGSPVDDGYGGRTYADPVEIACRWEDVVQISGTITAVQLVGFTEVSRAVVFVTQDVDENGIIYNGTLESLSAYMGSDGELVPADVPDTANIHIIKRFYKVPALGSTTEFLRKAFLTPWLS